MRVSSFMNARILLVTGSLILSVLIGSVIARRSGSSTTARKAGARPKIGLSLDTLKEERWQRDRDRFLAAAERLGAEVLVQSANGDDKTQASDVDSLLTSGIDVLVIVPHDAAAMSNSVAKARAARVPVISYDRLITNADVTLYISFDNEKVGEEQARYLVSRLPGGKGNIVRIYGSPTDNNAKLFKAGQDRVILPLVKSGAVTVVHEDWAQDWKPENAKKIMNAAITNGKGVDGVLASNDGTAGGAVQALMEASLAGKTVVTGQDAELAACQRIMRGTQSMTIYKRLSELADSAAEAAVKLAAQDIPVVTTTVNNGMKEVPSLLRDVVVVDKANMSQTVVKDGFHQAQDLQ